MQARPLSSSPAVTVRLLLIARAVVSDGAPPLDCENKFGKYDSQIRATAIDKEAPMGAYASFMSTWRESILDQADIPKDLDQLPLQITTNYHVTLARTGKRWTATVDNLPGGHIIQVQGTTWRETADNAMDRVFELLKYDPDTVGFSFTPAEQEAAESVENVRAARAARLHAEQTERDALRNAARTLIDKGWTTRDIGSVLGLSHQRISQIVPRTST